MEDTVSTIKAKRKQCHELQQELELLECTLNEQVLADAVAAMKQEVPLLQSIEATDATMSAYTSFAAIFTNGVTLHKGSSFRVYVSFAAEQFEMDQFALLKPGYVFKHKLKATRVAVNDAIAAWQKLQPHLDQVLPSNVKRRCVESLAESE
jgi:hypothetical protein